MASEFFSCRMTPEQRMLVIRMRGRMESISGQRVRVADVLVKALELLDEHTKKSPANLGDKRG